MTGYVIIFQWLAGQHYDQSLPPEQGSYLESYDPEYAGGMGVATWTTDPAKALTFSTVAEAAALYLSVPKARPRRGDGRPNRPLTAYTVEIGMKP